MKAKTPPRPVLLRWVECAFQPAGPTEFFLLEACPWPCSVKPMPRASSVSPARRVRGDNIPHDRVSSSREPQRVGRDGLPWPQRPCTFSLRDI
jgi:hypothetical protein